MKIAIEFDSGGHVPPGGRLSGRIFVEKGGSSRSLDVRASLREITQTEHAEVFTTEPQRIHEGDLETGTRIPFAIDVPADAPPSFACTYGKVQWAIVAHSDERGRDTTKAWTFVVNAPRR